MIKSLAIAGMLVLGLAACAPPLSPEEKAEQRQTWVKTANAAVPACIATIEGTTQDFSTFRELGYKHIRPPLQRGKDVFDSPMLTALNPRGDSYTFDAGKYCEVDYATDDKAITEIVFIWLSAIRANGHQVQITGQGVYTIVANGKLYSMVAYQVYGGNHPSSLINIRAYQPRK